MTTTGNWLDHLNGQQRQAVEHEYGPLLVLAGPGTGKTRVLAGRVARLIEKGLAYPAEVVAVTFTTRAALEMRERVEALLEGQGWDTDKIVVSTIHSLAYRIVYAESGRRPVTVVDEPATLKLIAQAVRQVGLDARVWDVKALARDIALAKDRLQSPDDFVARGRSPYLEIGQVYRCYQAMLAEKRSLDFDDLVVKAIRVLESDASLLAYYARPFILVDEYQDTSIAQYRLIKLLAGPGGSLMCVGSPVQSIYGFRGADAAYLLNVFQQDYPDARQIVLTDHYRCTGNILAAASSIVNGKYPDARNLRAVREAGAPIVLARFEAEDESAGYITRRVRELHDAGQYAHWNDFCILYRTNGQSLALQAALGRQQIPYTLADKQRALWEREEVSHMMAYVNLALDNADSAALDKIANAPPRGLGNGTLKKIKQGHPTLTLDLLAAAMGLDLDSEVLEAIYALVTLIGEDLPEKAASLPPRDFIEYVLEATGYRAWLEESWDYPQKLAHLRHLQDLAGEHDSVAGFAAAAREAAEAQIETPRGVLLSTLHAAKGLEFPVVFMAGMNQGVLPSAAALKLHRDPPEERRLCYVGMTRAKDLLYLVGERTNGQRKPVRPSLYLADVPAGLVRREW